MKDSSPKKKKKKKPHKKTEPPRDGTIPYGREAVKTAILDAAEQLLAKRPPNEITVREIARLANIKHPLIHRHFGTKDKVLLAVHERGINKIDRTIPELENIEGNIGLFFQAIETNKWRQLALARAMIDGVDPHLIQNQFPVMRRIVQLLKRRQDSAGAENEFGPEVSAAALAALALGWQVFEPFLKAATGLETEDHDEISEKLVKILEQMVEKIF